MQLPARDSDGKLPAYAWPGGYTLLYLDRENNSICAECATKSLDDPDEVPQYKPVVCHVYYEGPTLNCEQCNAEIESAYGDPNEPEPDLIYRVIVGNIGTVYQGTDHAEAEKHFDAYLLLSKGGQGRAGNESVTLMANGEPIKEHFGIQEN